MTGDEDNTLRSLPRHWGRSQVLYALALQSVHGWGIGPLLRIDRPSLRAGALTGSGRRRLPTVPETVLHTPNAIIVALTVQCVKLSPATHAALGPPKAVTAPVETVYSLRLAPAGPLPLPKAPATTARTPCRCSPASRVDFSMAAWLPDHHSCSLRRQPHARPTGSFPKLLAWILGHFPSNRKTHRIGD